MWASVYAFGSHLALVRADARHCAQVHARPALAGVHTLYSLYIASTCTKHRYERLAEALQLYSALQRSTALYISTALQRSTLYILYTLPQPSCHLAVVPLSSFSPLSLLPLSRRSLLPRPAAPPPPADP